MGTTDASYDERLKAFKALVSTVEPQAGAPEVAPGVPTIFEQLTALAHELPYIEERLIWLAKHKKLKDEFVALRRRDLRAVLETIRDLANSRRGTA
jgi:hypothetical protein